MQFVHEAVDRAFEHHGGDMGIFAGLDNRARCECHECTQARWKLTLREQIAVSLSRPSPLTSEQAGKPAPEDL